MNFPPPAPLIASVCCFSFPYGAEITPTPQAFDTALLKVRTICTICMKYRGLDGISWFGRYERNIAVWMICTKYRGLDDMHDMQAKRPGQICGYAALFAAKLCFAERTLNSMRLCRRAFCHEKRRHSRRLTERYRKSVAFPQTDGQSPKKRVDQPPVTSSRLLAHFQNESS